MKSRILFLVLLVCVIGLTACKTNLPGNNEETFGDSVTEISDRWEDLTLSVDNRLLSFPFSYSELKDMGWVFDISEYGDFESYVLNPGDKAGPIYIKNTKYPDEYHIEASVIFTNLSNTVKDIEDCQISSFAVNIKNYSDTVPDRFPAIELSKGIHFGSSKEEIVSAYGEPNSSYTASDYDFYQYEDMTANYVVMSFIIDKEYGLTKIAIDQMHELNRID